MVELSAYGPLVTCTQNEVVFPVFSSTMAELKHIDER